MRSLCGPEGSRSARSGAGIGSAARGPQGGSNLNAQTEVRHLEKTTLTQIAEWTRGECAGEAEIASFSTDSRRMGENCLFIPLVGERFDAHDFIPQALENGAAAVLSHRRGERYPVPTVYVEDTAQALLDLAGGYRAQFPCPVVAVTGSVGKTTTKELLAAVLGEGFRVLKTPANRNNTIGMPQAALELDDSVEAAVFEMGMNHFGEISKMAACGQPDIAVITNIGVSHIGNLGSREGICRAKLEITEGLAERGGCAVFNADEPLLWEKRVEFPFRVFWFGVRNEQAELTAKSIRSTADGVDFDLCWKAARYPAHLNLPGTHNVMNALAAAAAGRIVGLDPDQIVAGLAKLGASDTHARVYERGGYHIYEDVYNASPDAMEAALHAFGELPAARRFAALGGMLELGSFAQEGHRSAGRAAAAVCDGLYLYGPNAEDVRDGALEAGMDGAKIGLFDTHEELAAALRADARPGDALLFKGSHAMDMGRALTLFFETA